MEKNIIEMMESQRNKSVSYMIVTALVLAIVHQYLFFEQELGISYPLYVALFYGSFLWWMRDKQMSYMNFSGLLFAVIVALSMTYVLLTNPIFYVLNFLAIPLLVLIHTVLIASHRPIRWFDKRFVWNVLDHTFAQTLRHFATPFSYISKFAQGRSESKTRKTIGKVLMGLLISLPLLFIVIMLLKSADMAFNQLLERMFSGFGEVSFGEGFVRFIWVVLLFVILFGFMWGFREPVTYEWENAPRNGGVSGKVPGTGWDPVIVLTVLIAVNIVYVLFAAIQFSYLFGAWNGELPSGRTYAEHARSGFGELVVVAVINFGLLIGSLSFVRTVGKGLEIGNRLLLSLLVGCTAVMLGSAFVRLQLYEQVYGYTYIRFLVHAFMIYLALLLIVSGYRIWREKLPLMRVFVLISLIAYVVVNYVGMDRVIAEQNVKRYHKTGELDTLYLTNLSWEAIPVIADVSEDHPELLERLNNRYDRSRELNNDWRSFNWSRYRGEKILAGMKDRFPTRAEEE